MEKRNRKKKILLARLIISFSISALCIRFFVLLGKMRWAAGFLQRDTLISLALALLSGLIAFWLIGCIDFSGFSELRKLGKNSPLVFIFFLLLFTPWIDQSFHFSRRWLLQENRSLAPKPEFRYSAFWGYSKGFERYYMDHFGMRSLFIRWCSALNFHLLKVSPVPRVLIGRKGWLFLAQEGESRNCIDYYRGIDPFTRKDLEYWTQFYCERYEWLRQKGIHYLIAFVPDKSSIYSEFLPGRVRHFRGLTRLDQLLKYMGEHANLPVLDLRPGLLEAKKERAAYQHLDSHWTQWGAYSAYRAIMERVATDFPGLTPIPLSRFSFQTRICSGDLSELLALTPPLLETQTILVPDFPYLPNILSAKPSQQSGGRVVTEMDAPRLPALLMLMDSYGDLFMCWFSQHFRRAFYIMDRNRAFHIPFILREKPDLVIEEMSERFLLGLVPENPEEIRWQ